YDTARGRTILFGGTYDDVDDRAELWNTWEWDGAAWTPHAVAGPSQRGYVAMGYEAARSRAVLLGGRNEVPFTLPLVAFGDTWLWDGTSWTSKATSPFLRQNHAMSYDSARGRTVLFGGVTSGHGAMFGDTWEWDGAVWTQVASVGPPGRNSHA